MLECCAGMRIQVIVSNAPNMTDEDALQRLQLMTEDFMNSSYSMGESSLVSWSVGRSLTINLTCTISCFGFGKSKAKLLLLQWYFDLSKQTHFAFAETESRTSANNGREMATIRYVYIDSS